MFMYTFPVSGVETYWWFPGIVAFVISFFTSMGGLSGAFILMPFQMSILGFNSPAVTPTNLVYNMFSIPGGVTAVKSFKFENFPKIQQNHCLQNE